MLIPAWRSWVFVAGMAWFLCGVCAAHEGPEHVIDDLTAEILEQGPTAERHYRRACEYRALRRYPQAEADLRVAQKLAITTKTTAELGPLPIEQELVRVLLRQGKLDAAKELAEKLLQEIDFVALRPADGEILALVGETQLARSDWNRAVESFTLALQTRHEVGWYVLRARAQSNLDQAVERLAGLRTGYQATESPVLLRAVCDALIDQGGEHLAEASTMVARELVDCRYPSAWLIRRARILQQQGKPELAAVDLRAAVAELNMRIHPERPDLGLLVERGRAAALLGDFELARADLQRAEVRHAPTWMTAPLRELLPAVTEATVAN